MTRGMSKEEKRPLDPVTGLVGLEYFLDRVERRLGFPAAPGDHGSALFSVDLDRFRLVNKTQGHAVGDKLLYYVGRRILSCLNPGDMVARRGGDEFFVLIRRPVTAKKAVRRARRILSELSLPFNVDGVTFYLTASLGMVMDMEHYEKSGPLLRDLEIAMYRAKEVGAGHYRIFSRRMREQELRRFSLENALYDTLEGKGFSLRFQPIVRAGDGSPAGYETLLRWNHKTLGQVSPGEFVPVAEAAGLIVPIGEWVLNSACARLALWQNKLFGNNEYLTVNVSARQFAQPGFVERFKAILARHRIEPTRLKVEITESVLMNNPVRARHMLRRIQDMGVHILMDDFGTGYSSLSYLSDFAINGIKVDRAFVMGMERDGERLVTSILQLARNLDLYSVAEGVEEVEQFERLRELGCDYCQGFHFAMPLTEDEMREYHVEHTT